jgi:hypothetical protein
VDEWVGGWVGCGLAGVMSRRRLAAEQRVAGVRGIEHVAVMQRRRRRCGWG